MDPTLLKRTQEELGKFVKKPPLTDKLLTKPPFRFLHDIINAIITGTGFLSGLYTDDELSSDNIKDKEAKVAFLQKCIDATILATGEDLTVRPAKIVTGHEADKTNEWLQALGRAIAQKVDSSKAVEQVLSGVKPEKGGGKKGHTSNDKKADSSKTKAATDKKPEKAKREAAANNKPIRSNNANTAKEASGAKEPKSSSVSQPASSRRPSQSRDPQSKPKPPTSNRASIKPVESKKASLSKSTAQAAGKKPTTVKGQGTVKVANSSRSKDDKEGKAKSKGKDEERRGKSAKSRRSKDEKGKRKGKDGAAEASKTTRPSSRVGQVRESGKENSPPHEVLSEELIPNGHHVPEDEDVEPAAPRLLSSRPASAHRGLRAAPNLSDGPESLIQVDSQQPEEEEQQGGTPLLPPPDNSTIDPAILKAVAPNHDQVQLGSPHHDPPDSGVGSLESPKTEGKEGEGVRPHPSPRPGPPPLRALEPAEDVTLPSPPEPPQLPSNDPPEPVRSETPMRPRTGRRSARPPSARPAPPRVRERREIPKEELPRPGTAKPVANVILSSSVDGGDDDDDNFMVEEAKPVAALDDEQLPFDGGAIGGAAAATVQGDGEGAGLLVAQILETKKEMEDGRRNAFSPETPGHRRVPIEQTMLSDANRKKEREIIQKDVQKLSTSIQSITRSVNPLAKMLDYLQEDLDSMHKELEMWCSENKLLTQTLKREQSATDQALEPLNLQLYDLETAVQEQRDRLSAVKSNILRNNDKISRLMAGITMNA